MIVLLRINILIIKKDVEISNNLKEQVIQTSKKVIEMANNGIKIPFYDITKMKRKLIEKYINDKQ